jgi:ubiquinone/menaquinone biosynthesis C-methylase UbiE
MTARRNSERTVRTSWEPLANWYDGWMGKDGSIHHRKLAVPAVMELLDPRPGDRILDIGAGQGVLAPAIHAAQAHYIGVEASPTLLRQAQRYHGTSGTFLQGDARHLTALPELERASFDAAVFLLSIQDMDPLTSVLEGAAWMLRGGGRVVILMTHPCFRVPRQSGWGWQEERKLQYRRIDRYLTPLSIPLKAFPGRKQGTSMSFHRPLQHYINGLAECGLLVDRMKEITTYKTATGPRAKAENLANQEIPLFLGLRSRKL